MRLAVRFNEFPRYDIQQDCEVIRFVGVTDMGTFHTELPIVGSRKLRETREHFKDEVIKRMSEGEMPQEISL